MQESSWQPADEVAPSQKKAPQDSAFELERPGNRRLKKAPIILLLGAVGVLLVTTIYLALRPASSATAPTQRALIDPEAIKRGMPDSLKLNDRDFAKADAAPEVPKLGEPLQGDLGGLQLKPLAPLALPATPVPAPAYTPPPPKQPSPEELAKLRREALAREMAEKALTAGLFFDVPTQPQPVPQNQPLIQSVAHSANPVVSPSAYQPPQPLLAASQRGQGGYAPLNDGQPSLQLQAAGSPYQVKAGTLIPAVLLTGINADLPGQIIAQVREQVYDTVTGRYLLIPQGTRVLGEYDHQLTYGQERAGVVWNRLILPDGASISLGNMPGVDSMGQSGYQDQVDHHWGRLTTGVVLSSLLAGTAGYQGQRDDYAGRFYDNVGMEINRAGQRLTRNNLNIQPTIQIRPGFSINILVNRDLTLKPIPLTQTNPWEAALFPAQYQ